MKSTKKRLKYLVWICPRKIFSMKILAEKGLDRIGVNDGGIWEKGRENVQDYRKWFCDCVLFLKRNSHSIVTTKLLWRNIVLEAKKPTLEQQCISDIAYVWLVTLNLF